jgi:hypothetical protein
MRFNAANQRIATTYVSGTRIVGRGYLYFVTLPSGDVRLIQTNQTAGPSVLFVSSDSKIYARSDTTNGASGVAVTTGQFYRIDFDFHIETAGADFCDVQVDGTACGQATATGASASPTALQMGLNAAVTGDVIFDDMVFSNTAADYPIGAGYVDHFVPTADGTHNVAGAADFRKTLTATDILNSTTDAYQLVDDVPLEAVVTDWINMIAPVNATDYVECIFGPAPGISAPTTGPRAVEIICGINQAGTGVGNMEIRINDNATLNTLYTATGVAGVAVATGQVFKRKHYATAIAGGGAWVIGGGGNGDFTDLRIRFGSPAALDVNPDQYFGCAMIEAEFAPAAPAAFLAERPYVINQTVARASTY